MTPGRRIEELDAMSGHDSEHAHFAYIEAPASRVQLFGVPGGKNPFIHDDQRALAPRLRRRGYSNCGEQIQRAIGTDTGRRPLSSHHYNWTIGLYSEMKEKCGFVETR